MHNLIHKKASQGAAIDSVQLLPPVMTIRLGQRRITLSRRPTKQLPQLLCGLLRRSFNLVLKCSLRLSHSAAAIAAVCALWNAPVFAAAPVAPAAPAANALPTGWNVTTGSASFAQTGNTLNVVQHSQQAISNFSSFNIGANAAVNISQPNAAASFLARVTGTDISQIYGLLKANGTVALINQNGILVGPTGVVDVARFIASTLNISDSDFLAGRLTFNGQANAGKVENQGSITTANGGSIYLIGANVDNSGVLRSPNGEILLAAGQSVQLVDTMTPGVSVAVTGSAGKVTNLGHISAEAGRIGIAAGLINNSGNVNASSGVQEGGRIFLRASQNLTTTASSNISADGNKGGSVVLYAANVDGDVSVIGLTGSGGFVDTSGKQSLNLVKAPKVNAGGQWLIDPYDLEVVDCGCGNTNTSGSSVITSIGNSAKVQASSILSRLNEGVNVTLTTGGGRGGSAKRQYYC